MIQPITGAFRRRVIMDITVGFAVGGAMASWWWWGFHKNKVRQRELYYDSLAKTESE